MCAGAVRLLSPLLSARPGVFATVGLFGDDLAVDIRDLKHGLKHLVWQWDPIGVADIAPDDEYDCLVSPLLSRLAAGAGRSKISEFLWFELEGHFGLDPSPYDVDAMADRLVAGWAAVGVR